MSRGESPLRSHGISSSEQPVGKEKGIKVEAASQGSVDDLQKNVMDSINGIAGAEEMPNIFAAYADTAYEIDQMGKLANLRDYFTEDELNEYVSGYIEEGCFNGSSELKILPIAKSTEVLFLNATDWEKFSEASGAVDFAEAADRRVPADERRRGRVHARPNACLWLAILSVAAAATARTSFPARREAVQCVRRRRLRLLLTLRPLAALLGLVACHFA